MLKNLKLFPMGGLHILILALQLMLYHYACFQELEQRHWKNISKWVAVPPYHIFQALVGCCAVMVLASLMIRHR